MSETRTCQYCGAAVPEEEENCLMCGSPVTPPPTPTYTHPEAPAVIEPEVVEPEVVGPEAIPPPRPEPVIQVPQAEPQPSNRWIAVAIEVLAGMVGFLGIGWMIAGKIVAGILTMIGYWFFLFGYAILLFSQTDATNGWSLLAFCCVPIFPLISGLVLYLRTK